MAGLIRRGLEPYTKIILVQAFGGNTPVKIMASLNKAMGIVDCIQVEKALFSTVSSWQSVTAVVYE